MHAQLRTRAHTAHLGSLSFFPSRVHLLRSTFAAMNNAFCDTGNIDELTHESDLKFVPIDWMANNSHLVVEDDANQHYVVTQGRSDGIFQVPVSMPQLMSCQQTPQSYVKFLAESGYPEIQNIFSPNISAPIPSLGLENHSQKEESNEDYGSAFQAYLGSGATALKYPSNASRKRSREKAYAADRSRRLKISQRLDALQDMFPHFKEGGKADLVDYVVDQVKYLQYQVKTLSALANITLQDLCQSKLGGEPSSSSSTFLEGHGHFLVYQQMLSGSLEEMMGRLLELYPSAALELFESRGLVLMPMEFAGELYESIGMPDMQEKAHFYPQVKFGIRTGDVMVVGSKHCQLM